MKIERTENDTFIRISVAEGYYDDVRVMAFKHKDELSIDSQWPRFVSLKTARKMAALLTEAIKQAEALEVEMGIVFEEGEAALDG